MGEVKYGVIQNRECIGSYDLIKLYLPEINTTAIANHLINTIGMDRINLELGAIEADDIPFISALEDFKYSKIDYKTLCSRIADSYSI